MNEITTIYKLNILNKEGNKKEGNKMQESQSEVFKISTGGGPLNCHLGFLTPMIPQNSVVNTELCHVSGSGDGHINDLLICKYENC